MKFYREHRKYNYIELSVSYRYLSSAFPTDYIEPFTDLINIAISEIGYRGYLPQENV